MLHSPRRQAFLIQTLAPCAGLPAEQRAAEAERGCRGCFAIFVAVMTTVALVRPGVKREMCETQFVHAGSGVRLREQVLSLLVAG